MSPDSNGPAQERLEGDQEVSGTSTANRDFRVGPSGSASSQPDHPLDFRARRKSDTPTASRCAETILETPDEHAVKYRDRLFGPFTTIWSFLSQVLSEDHSCRDAVSRIIAHRAASGLKICSPNTASYCNCNARARIPAAVLRTLARRSAQQLQDGVPNTWKWDGRSVLNADGSYVSMPERQLNQASYPQ